MSARTKPCILFIEDEQNHFAEVSKYLRDRYQLHRVGTKDLPGVGKIAKSLRPEAAVVDIMLYTCSVEEAQSQTTEYIQWLEKRIKGDKGPAPVTVRTKGKSTECKSGLESIHVLKSVCPSIRVLVCSQLLNRTKENSCSLQAGYCGADAAVAKHLDGDGNLVNGEQIAAKVRLLIERE